MLFGKCFLVTVGIIIIIILADRVGKTSLHALLPEKLTHGLQVLLTAAVCFSCLDVTVAHKKMDVLVRLVGVNGEHDLIAVKKLLGELLGDVEHFFIGQLIVIIGRERQRHLERKVRPLVITLAEQLSCGENIAGVNVAVTVHLPS